MRPTALLLVAVLAGVLLPGLSARADLTAADAAAEKVVTAFDAKDAETLKALAGTGAGGTWLVADALVGRGRLDVAEAYAAASPEAEREAVVRYVAGPAQDPHTTELRKRYVAVRALLVRRKFEEANAELDKAAAGPPSVPLVYLEQLRAARLRSEDRRSEALDTLHRAGELAETLGHRIEAMSQYFANGRYALGWQDYPRAERSWQQALVVARAYGPQGVPYVAELCGRLASVVDYRGAYREGLALNREALALHRKLGNQQWVAAVLSNSGVEHIYLGELTDALDSLEQAHALQVKIGDQKNAAITLGTLASAHEELGELERALELHAASLAAKRKLGLQAPAARTLSSMARIHWRRGAYDRFFALMDEALALNRKIDNKHGVGFVLGRVGQAYVELGDYERAATLLPQARTILESIGAADQAVHVWSALADLHRARRDYPAAIALHEEAIAQHKATESTAELCGAIHDLATTLGDAGRHDEALTQGMRALALASKVESPSLQAYAHVGVASAHASLGHYALAMQHVTAAREKAGEGAEEKLLFALDGTTIEAAHVAGKHAEAVAAAHVAAKNMQARYRLLADEERAGARARWAQGLARGVISAAKLGRAEDAFSLIEQGRATALREALGGEGSVGAATLEPALQREEAEARAQAAAAVRRLRAAHADEAPGERLRTLRGELRDARTRLEETDRRIQRAAAGAGDLTASAPPTLATVQGTLAASEALVLYATLGHEAVAVVVTSRSARVLELGPSEILRDLCRRLLRDRDGTIDAEVQARLGAAVVAPLRLKADIRHVRMAPDGPLGYVPFALLLPERDVVYTPSAATGALLASWTPAKDARVLALGDPVYEASGTVHTRGPGRAGFQLTPLPATKQEAEAVGDVVLTGTEASEAKLRDALATRSRWRAVHLACHGLVDPERPAFCALALTPGGDDDGFLTALEVMRMRVPAEIVVLSACETARGRIYAGEGILGLTRAFFLAGASRVLVSLWRVDDRATRMLMEQFYKAWRAGGAGPAAALRRAQAYVRSFEQRVVSVEASRKAGHDVYEVRKPYADPRYWAGWVLWGRR